MLNQAAQFILETVLNLFLLVVMLRFYLQFMRAPFHHPFCQFVSALTNFAVLPLRHIIPSGRRVDLAALLLAWLTKYLLLAATLWLKGFPFLVAGAEVFAVIALLALVALIKLSIYMLIVVVFAQAVLSWISPFNQLMPLLNLLTRPFLRVVQKYVPPIANVDLSPLIIFIFCELLLIVPVAWLESLVRGML